MKYAIATLMAAGLATAASAQDKTVTLGQVGLSFYAVVGGVVQEVLEERGYTVEVVEGSHSEIFPMLGAGEVDLLAAAWLPGGHAALHEPVEDVTFRIAPIYEDARFFWVVPSYVPEDMIASVADLTRPEVAERLPDTIVSLPEATGLTTGGRRVMEAYDLGSAGYTLEAAPPANWIGTFETAVRNEEWVVFPLWQPQWVNAAHDIRVLEEPQNAYGDPDTAWLIGHESLRDTVDAQTLALLEAIRLPVDVVTEMDRRVNVDGLSPRAAARSWMEENPEAVAAWGSG